MRLVDVDKLLRDIPLKVCVPCPFGEEKECADCVIENVMKRIDDAPTVEPASPWHRVEEPPKEEGKYLVYDGRGNYYVAWWGQRLGWCYDPKFFCYWMPIEPPEEDA